MQNGVIKLASCILAADLARLGEQVIEADVFVAGSLSSVKSGCVLCHGPSVRPHCPSSRFIW